MQYLKESFSKMEINPQDLYRINLRVWEALSGYGECQAHVVESTGKVIMTLPSCTTPLHHLVEENWDPLQRKLNHGNFRRVRWVYQLKDGEPTSLYVKGSEHYFSGDLRNLEEGFIWWGGPDSGEEYSHLSGGIVEEQVEWEAIFLLELLRNKIPAEIPQAIIQHKNGRKELAVLDVCKTDYNALGILGHPYEEEMALIESIGLELEDEADYIKSKNDLLAIIDLNRCIWRPHTDGYRRELLQTILDKLKH